MTVRTRFAPSPTGFLHIGGVRTAPFNWLLARRHGGRFILRIDDTDQQRHVEEAVGLILEGFRWMGMDWDEGPDVGGAFGPYFQSQRGDTYKAAADALVAAGAAYRDYSTEAKRAADREAAGRSKTAYRFRELPIPDSERARLEAEGAPFALRFRVPTGRSVVVDDLIKGRVEQKTDEIGDFVIVRPDGSPLYNFASVVDDAGMGITHVVRAEEHLANTYSQVLVFEALGHALPAFAHVPYVARAGVPQEALQAVRRRGARPLHRERVSARRDDELSGQARLEPRRQSGDFHPRGARRELLAGPRDQLARQPRPRQAPLASGRVDETALDDREGGRRAAVPPRGRAGRQAALGRGSRPASRPSSWRLAIA